MIDLSKLKPGDILVTIFDWTNPLHWPFAWGAGSKYLHTTIYLGNGLEWSIEGLGSRIRRVGSDRIQEAYRPLDEAYLEPAARLAMRTIITEYDIPHMLFLGLTQAILHIPDRSRPNLSFSDKAKICSEGVTDIYVAVGYDVVPDFENGQTMPRDITTSKMLRRVA
jgi:hypothetical protein